MQVKSARGFHFVFLAKPRGEGLRSEELTCEWRGGNACLEEVDWRAEEWEGCGDANKRKSFGVAIPVSKEQALPPDR